MWTIFITIMLIAAGLGIIGILMIEHGDSLIKWIGDKQKELESRK